jgi:hypothetical protein
MLLRKESGVPAANTVVEGGRSGLSSEEGGVVAVVIVKQHYVLSPPVVQSTARGSVVRLMLIPTPNAIVHRPSLVIVRSRSIHSTVSPRV